MDGSQPTVSNQLFFPPWDLRSKPISAPLPPCGGPSPSRRLPRLVPPAHLVPSLFELTLGGSLAPLRRLGPT